MADGTYSRTFIREWRLSRGLSLRKLSSMTASHPGGEPVISHASLGRIEKGEQPYSQAVLEAVSRALNVPTALLLESRPDENFETQELIADFRTLDPSKRRQVINFVKFLVGQP
ncbi:MAG TPA: helix-turn-helix transcriptional regulator [Kaistia sp.]|nr:helix-turn-helix transcriptional regulator [Kaistia sp.]